MRSWLRSWVVVVPLVLSGCGAATAPPVQVEGTPADMQSLAGTWHGTFRNAQMRRSGQIDFQMSANSDSAVGEVRMYTDNPSNPIWSRPPGSIPPGGATELPPSWLGIRFVRIDNGYVSGEMEPMYEPRCQCHVVAKFVGRMNGPAIEGSFTSRSTTTRFESSGSWHVERVTTPPQ